MISYGSVSGVLDVVGTFVGWEAVEDGADPLPGGFGGSFGGVSQQMFEFGEDLLDRVQVGTVWRQEQQVGAGVSDGFSDGCVLWLARLSITTASPGASVGTRKCST